MATHSAAQVKVLNTLRSLLRHVNGNIMSCPEGSGAAFSLRYAPQHGTPVKQVSDVVQQHNDVSIWRKAIIMEYRDNQAETSKKAQRRYRGKAVDMLTLLDSVVEEQSLLRLYGGIDDSSPEYIAKAAARVGLQVPAPVVVDTRDWDEGGAGDDKSA